VLGAAPELWRAELDHRLIGHTRLVLQDLKNLGAGENIQKLEESFLEDLLAASGSPDTALRWTLLGVFRVEAPVWKSKGEQGVRIARAWAAAHPALETWGIPDPDGEIERSWLVQGLASPGVRLRILRHNWVVGEPLPAELSARLLPPLDYFPLYAMTACECDKGISDLPAAMRNRIDTEAPEHLRELPAMRLRRATRLRRSADTRTSALDGLAALQRDYPERLDVTRLLAKWYEEEGMHAEAIASHERYLEASTSTFLAEATVGTAIAKLELARNDPAAAMEWSGRASESGAEWARQAHAEVCALAGQFDEAREEIERNREHYGGQDIYRPFLLALLELAQHHSENATSSRWETLLALPFERLLKEPLAASIRILRRYDLVSGIPVETERGALFLRTALDLDLLRREDLEPLAPRMLTSQSDDARNATVSAIAKGLIPTTLVPADAASPVRSAAEMAKLREVAPSDPKAALSGLLGLEEAISPAETSRVDELWVSAMDATIGPALASPAVWNDTDTLGRTLAALAESRYWLRGNRFLTPVSILQRAQAAGAKTDALSAIAAALPQSVAPCGACELISRLASQPDWGDGVRIDAWKTFARGVWWNVRGGRRDVAEELLVAFARAADANSSCEEVAPAILVFTGDVSRAEDWLRPRVSRSCLRNADLGAQASLGEVSGILLRLGEPAGREDEPRPFAARMH
jgi:hypothetical protein